MTDEVDVDLFGGARGAGEGLRRAGVHAIGYEKWPVACATARANGHETIECDLSTHDWTGHPPVRLMWASPPCQPFSAAGDQEGEFDDRDGIPWWLRALEELRPRVAVMENVRGLTFEKHSDYLARALDAVRALGYQVDWRVLDAADYGVPQNRERFILLARRDGGRLSWPAVTHTEGGGLFTKPWVTMADALGWGYDDQPSRAVCGNRTPRWLYEDRDGTHGRVLHTNRGQDENGDRQTVDPETRPAPALTGKSIGQWQLRPGITEGRNLASWCWERPATVVMADPRIFQPGGHHQPGEQSQNAVRVEVWEAAVLQGFPKDYIFCGGRTDQATQVGNAVPPPLAEAIVRALLEERAA